MDLKNAPDPVPQYLLKKSRKKKLDKSALFLIIHLLVIVSVPFSISDLPPENLFREDPFHSIRGESPALLLEHEPSRRVIISC